MTGRPPADPAPVTGRADASRLPAEPGSGAGDVAPDRPLRWWVRVDGPLEGAVNMARDHALALALPEGAAALRFYRWRRPTLSLGRNEPARSRTGPRPLAQAGVDVVRRPTGGRAVLHHRELTYAVVLPLRALGGVRETYRRINRGLVAGLGALGVPVGLSGADAPVLPPDAGPCFRVPAPGEVTAGGGKLVGSAQARIGGALLQHGSLLLHDDQGRLPELLGSGPDGVPGEGALPSGAVSLSALVAELPEVDSLVAALTRGLASELGGDWPAAPGGATFVPPALEREWVARYRDPSWTWRR